MSAIPTVRRTAVGFAVVATLGCTAVYAPAYARARGTPHAALPVRPTARAATLALPTTATITPTLAPDRLGAKAALTLTVSYTGGEAGVPTPVRRSILQLPAGLGLEIPSLRSCDPARLLAHGVSGCPRQSEIGHGYATAAVLAGSLKLTERIALTVFTSALGNTGPTFAILARGYTPLDQRMVFTGTVLPDRPPYGEQLEVVLPPIPTLPHEPDASIVGLSLTMGTSERPRQHDANTVVIPVDCPPGGFPFAAAFTYADGSSGNSIAAAPCPPHATRQPRPHAPTDARARVAKTVSLEETGDLHLTSKHNFTLNEQGTATGTAAGAIYVHLTLVSSSRMTAEVNIYPHGGSISGSATGTFHRVSGAADFTGTMSITRGTGSYARIAGSGLSFTGTLAEASKDITVHVRGRVSD
jgi:hypothetical protein